MSIGIGIHDDSDLVSMDELAKWRGLAEETKELCENVYFERTLCVLAIARAAFAEGCAVSFAEDNDLDDSDKWTVLLIELPTGQVSWHLRSEHAKGTPFPTGNIKWDGHTTEQKYERLAAWHAFLSPAHKYGSNKKGSRGR